MFHPFYNPILRFNHKRMTEIHRVRRENIKSLSSSFLDVIIWAGKLQLRPNSACFYIAHELRIGYKEEERRQGAKGKGRREGKMERRRGEYVTDCMWPQIPKIFSLWARNEKPFPSPGHLPGPRDWTRISCLAGRLFTDLGHKGSPTWRHLQLRDCVGLYDWRHPLIL